METVTRGRRSQSPDPVRPQESWVFPHLQSALPKTSQVGRNFIPLWLCHWTLGREEEPGRWTIRRTRQWDRLQGTDCPTTGNLGSYHGWTVRWPPSKNQNSPGYRRIGCRLRTQDPRHSTRWYPRPAKNRRIRGRIEKRMESHCRRSHLRRKYLCPKGWPTSQQSHKPFQRQTRIRSLWSSQNRRVDATGFPLVCIGCHHTTIHRGMGTMPQNQGTMACHSRHKHATGTNVTALGRSDHRLRHRPPWVNCLRV